MLNSMLYEQPRRKSKVERVSTFSHSVVKAFIHSDVMLISFRQQRQMIMSFPSLTFRKR
jgi:hypothetical protein